MPTLLYSRPDGHVFAYQVLAPSAPSSKPPLVLIHGMSSAGIVDWLPLANTLSLSRTVVTFDHRNIGASTSPNSDAFSLHDLAQDVIQLIRHLQYSSVDLLGFSMGGMILQHIMVTPDLPFEMRHVILTGTSSKSPHSKLIEAMPDPSKKKSEMTREEQLELVKPMVFACYDPAFIRDPKNAELLRQRVIEAATIRRPAKTIINQVQAIGSYDVRRELSKFTSSIPILLIHGKLDKAVFFTEQKYTLLALPHAEVAKTPSDDYGHNWSAFPSQMTCSDLDRYDYFTPDFWSATINEFLDRAPLPAALRESKL